MTRPSVVKFGVALVVVVLAASSLVVFATAPGVAHVGVPRDPLALSYGWPPSAGPHAQGSPLYVITFYETGLPANKVFEVTVGRASSSTVTDGLTDYVVFSDPNGTYSYTIHGIPGWQQSTLPYRGSITVAGAAISEPTLDYVQTTYSVSFSESGVPSGQTFAVSLNGSLESLTTDGATDTLSFQAPNGTESYAIAAISGWQQGTLPYRGSVTVHGAAVVETTLLYTRVTYTVSFSENGLPAGLTFGVTVNGTAKSLTTTTSSGTLTWTGFPNGSYPYSIGHVAGWQQGTLAPTGTVIVAGFSVTEPTLMYTKWTYLVTFSETGLPVGQVFGVSVGSNHESVISDGGTDALQFAEPNGSYSYTIATVSGWYQTTLPYHGTVVVSAAGVTETTVVFTQVFYSISYTETGLPSGTSWSFTLNGSTQSTTGTTLSYTEPNGSYPFKVGYVAGYATTPTSGVQVVNGANLNVGVPFTQVTYAVTFTESGLPGGSHWSLTVNGHSPSSSTTTIVVQLPNGTFPYTVGGLPGYDPVSKTGSVIVNGGPVPVAVPFRLVTYAVTFAESGLPPSHHPKAWTVSLGNTVNASTGSSISFYVPNGTYPYLIEGPSGYRVSSVLTPQGTITVKGAGTTTPVVFLRGSTGSISFHESGLGSGSRWCATIGAMICTTSTRVVVPDLTPGTYNYSVSGVSGLTTIVREGKSVLGSSGSIALAHSASLKVEYTYSVTFRETGLTGTFSWKMTVGSSSVTSTTSTITLYIENGTYGFHVGKIKGEVASPASGSIKVAGGPLTVNIKFTTKT